MDTTYASLYRPDMLPMQQKTEKQLERELQQLLDAQGEGLCAGLDLNGPDDTASEDDGSRSMRASSWQGTRSRSGPGQGARRRKLSLNEARLGILGAMRELATLKDAEVVGLQMRVEESQVIVAQLEDWKDRKDGLQKEIENIESSEDVKKLRELEDDEGKVKQEIHELETRLYQLNAKQRHLASEISRVKNSVDAKLSSYQASMSILNKQIQDFLSHPPGGRRCHRESEEPSSFMKLPSGRRTLAMARQHWKDESETLNTNLEQVEFERDALEDGAQVWEDVVVEVNRFETSLRKELRRLHRPSRDGRSSAMFRARNASNAGSTSADDIPKQPQALTRLISEMDRTISLLESKLRLAEARNWKLLVCCIGAELEAFQEGKEVITNSLRPPNASSTSPASRSYPGNNDGNDDSHDMSHHLDDLDLNSQGNLPQNPGGQGQLPAPYTEGAEGEGGKGRVEDDEDAGAPRPPDRIAEDAEDDEEDPGPDPDLLISHEQ